MRPQAAGAWESLGTEWTPRARLTEQPPVPFALKPTRRQADLTKAKHAGRREEKKRGDCAISLYPRRGSYEQLTDNQRQGHFLGRGEHRKLMNSTGLN